MIVKQRRGLCRAEKDGCVEWRRVVVWSREGWWSGVEESGCVEWKRVVV